MREKGSKIPTQKVVRSSTTADGEVRNLGLRMNHRPDTKVRIHPNGHLKRSKKRKVVKALKNVDPMANCRAWEV